MLRQVEYLPVFWKQQHMLFFDAFSFSFPAFLQRIPFSLAAATTWTVVTYFPVGLAGEASRCCPVHHHAPSTKRSLFVAVFAAVCCCLFVAT